MRHCASRRVMTTPVVSCCWSHLPQCRRRFHAMARAHTSGFKLLPMTASPSSLYSSPSSRATAITNASASSSSAVRRFLSTASQLQETSNNNPSSALSASSSSPSSSISTPLQSLFQARVGDLLHGFRVQEVTPAPDFGLVVYRLEHESTGAHFYHLARDDAELAFAVTFRTPPRDSSGVAHVLEHTALCGSRAFPVRDPFFSLHRRSLKTYMNAMTAQDFTTYPFSTLNLKDFDNLLSVYLDAAFRPLLREMDFKQEGIRLEFDDFKSSHSSGDEQGEAETEDGSEQQQQQQKKQQHGDEDALHKTLTFKGVVFNEMKGAMSDTSQLFAQRLQSLLFADPRNLYHHNSGGEPAEIPRLTHTQLCDFHRRHYAPEKACFFSYGNQPPPLAACDRILCTSMKEREAEGLAVSAADVEPYFAQPTLNAPSVHHATCPPDPMVSNERKQSMVSTAFMLSSSLAELSPEDLMHETFSLSLLSSLLLDGPEAPFYQALIEADLGNGFAPGTGFDGDALQATFAVGVQGCALEDADRVLETVQGVLTRCAATHPETAAPYQRAFSIERVEAILHQIEIGIKHVKTQFGVSLMMGMMSQWAHGRSALNALRINEKIARLRQRLNEDPQHFSGLVRRHLLDNRHRVTLIMSPDAEYSQRENERESAQLQSLQQRLTSDERLQIEHEAAELRAYQDTPNDPAVLPTLSATDIARSAERVTLTLSSLPTPVPCYELEAATNGCSYARLLFDLRQLPEPLREWLPLFASLLSSMGAGELDYRQLAHELERHTGGLSASLQTASARDDPQLVHQVLVLRGMALERNVGHLLRLASLVLRRPRWSEAARLKQLLLQTAAASASSLQDSGHSYARSCAGSTLQPAGHLAERLGGVTAVRALNDIAVSLNSGSHDETATLQRVTASLQAITDFLLHQGPSRALLVGDSLSLGALRLELPSFLDDIAAPTHHAEPIEQTRAWTLPGFEASQHARRIFYALPLAVNHVSLVLPTVPHTHVDSAPLTVAAKLLSSVFVHREVREKGGAYGGGASHGDAMFSFYSFRDPHHVATLEAFQRGLHWLTQSNSFTEADVDEALLSIFSSVDAPTPPAAKGMSQFVYGITHAERQLHRDRLLSVNKRDIMRVSEMHLLPKMHKHAQICVVGDQTKVGSLSSDAEWEIRSVDAATQSTPTEELRLQSA